ncbi:hypothetical protein S7335_2443 [Synechococcus sp. PCC 7335]|nr:hypothetical protein S7335_2443 [Synechococcus sp. PCC 7335]
MVQSRVRFKLVLNSERSRLFDFYAKIEKLRWPRPDYLQDG